MEEKKYNTTIISGFPGTGKTSFLNHDYQPDGFAIDSDSSKFDKKNFPKNYIKNIKKSIGKHKIIFVSSHKEVREALVDNGIDFNLVYPNKTLKLEYVKRYIDRGDNIDFVDLLYNNWDVWLDELSIQSGCKHIVLNQGEYMSNTNLKLK